MSDFVCFYVEYPASKATDKNQELIMSVILQIYVIKFTRKIHINTFFTEYIFYNTSVDTVKFIDSKVCVCS